MVFRHFSDINEFAMKSCIEIWEDSSLKPNDSTVKDTYAPSLSSQGNALCTFLIFLLLLLVNNDLLSLCIKIKTWIKILLRDFNYPLWICCPWTWPTPPAKNTYSEKKKSSWDRAAHLVPNTIWEHNDSIHFALRLMEQAQVL